MGIKLILASCSPRRRELIKLLGLPYECVSADTDESAYSADPSVAVCEIAARKAVAVYKERELSSGEIIIGADTVVVHGGQLLGKPENKAHARHMLKMLSNNTHDVYTGVTLLYEQNGRLLQHSFSECTQVEFSELSDEEAEAYIDTDDYRDKAGSYAIQGIFSKHVKGIHGDYNNVVGFPVSRIYRELKAIGLINKD